MENMPKPVHKNLYESIRKKIRSQEYKAGDLLPSENDYCKSLQVTRPTVRQALSKLEAEGFIKKHKGKGSIVQEPKQGLGILSVTGTTGAAGNQELITRVIKNPYQMEWPQPFIFPLTDLEINAGCIVLERLRFIKNSPVILETTYFPDGYLNGFKDINFSEQSLFETLRKKYDINVIGGEQKIKAINAPNLVAKLLQIQAKKPILHLERKIFTSKNDFCFYSSLFCFTDNHYLFGTF
jgi:GntR family transcriptional regulator/GntR family frlABCD operon transcriptional regulator